MEAKDLLKQLAFQFAPKNASVLEVGAGSGVLLSELADWFEGKICGIDPFVQEKESGRISLKPLVAEDLSKLPRRYDLIFSVHSFHHFKNIGEFFKGLEEKLSWQGRFILVDWKKGASTGIPERYFSSDEVLKMMEPFNLEVLTSGIEEDNFFLVAKLKVRKIAVASDGKGKIFKGMFGRAPVFDIFEINNQDHWKWLEVRENIYQNTMQHLKTLDVYELVNDCQALLSNKIGKKGQQRLADIGVKQFFAEGAIESELQKLILRD